MRAPTVLLDRRRVALREGTGIATFRAGLHDAAAKTGADIVYLDDADPARRAPRFPAFPASRAVRAAVQGNRLIVPDVFRRAQSRFSATGDGVDLIAHPAPDIAHWSHLVPLRIARAINLYTVHDLIPIDHPALSGVSPRRFEALLLAQIERGAHFMTVSQTVRGALIERYDMDAARVTCAYQAVVAPVAIGALPDGVVPGGYVLCLGRFEPRKNVARLIAAHRRADTGLPLLFVGPDGHWPNAAARRAVARQIDGHSVRRLGWQDAATIAALVAQARALLMPSLAEGFGLPVIEAMRCGVPTLAADHGAGGEIAGRAALRVDVLDESAIAVAIARLARDAALRARLIALGQERAERFGPEHFVERLRLLYQRLGHP